ncbi:hypothetical protein Btru_005138 [Bulinus truncatus]|nr:hypothetical protein Btru_005138 [Bulinus truncatus]
MYVYHLTRFTDYEGVDKTDVTTLIRKGLTCQQSTGRKGGKGEYPGYRSRLYKQTRMKSLIFTLLLVVLLVGQAEMLAISGGGGGCTTDAECAAKYKGGICVRGTCYRPTGLAEQQELTTARHDGVSDGIIDITVGGSDGIIDITVGGSDGIIDITVGGSDGIIDITVGGIDDIIDGRHEIHIENGTGEAHLQTEVDCAKNPGHSDFIPAHELDIGHLPGSFQDEVIYQLVRLMIDFTVKIDVRATSPLRPKCWEGSDVAYPFFGQQGSRVGTGGIRGVYRYSEGYNGDGRAHWRNFTSCACRRCLEGSETPSKDWWEVEVVTATHVVFDDAEASHASCTLFYDKKGCPAVTLDTVVVDYANVETDKCWLRCVTCDPGLLTRLDTMIRDFDQTWVKVYKNYGDNKYTDRLALIVSHPHGCSKQVSFGRWVDRVQLEGEEDLSCYTYTSPTCPGTSGATVYILGYHNGRRFMYSDHHVHSGVSKSGLNYCGFGYDL